MNLIVGKQALTMSSREIADLTGATHDNVLKTIRGLAAKGLVSGNDTPYVHPQNGQTYFEFKLSYRDTMVVVSGYSAELRAKIIDRWQELESADQPPREMTRLELIHMMLESETARIQAESDRDHAIQTKAEIGNRREATAMATASTQTRKANKLEQELDRSKEWATIKRMEMAYHGQKFSWRILKSAAQDMGIPAKDVFDANYGTVKAYHRDVWHEAYALEVL